MKKSVVFLYVILFIFVCILPSPIYSLFGEYFGAENYEKRLSNEAPTLSLSNLQSFPKEYEEYFNDNIPFRSKLIEVNSLIDYFIFNRSPVSRVIRGEEGWLFYNPNGTDGDPVADFTGSNIYTEEKMAECAANLTSVRDTLRQQGKTFVVMVAPNKATIYGEEYLPDNYIKAEKTRADLLVDYLNQNTDLTVVYPKEDLLSAKNQNSEQLLYYKTDSHWNAVGAYIGTRSLLSTINITLPNLNEVKITQSNECAGDLANMIALNKYLKYDNDYSVENYTVVTNVDIKYPFENNKQVIHHTTNDKDERKLFLIHDSFAEGLIPYLRTEFNEFHSVHINFYKPEYLSEINPEIVVFEVAERYLDSLFTFEV